MKGDKGEGRDVEREWLETTYGSRWPNTSSPQRHQIWQMECVHCDFKIDPGSFRMYSDHRPDHPQPYGNMASISHARKLMRDHLRTAHSRPVKCPHCPAVMTGALLRAHLQDHAVKEESSRDPE